MQFPYGAVYFRKSNPPRQDWERDYGVVAQDGTNIFRHWFMWGAIEVAPGVYDWEDYDRHMDLATKHGMKVIIAEFMDAVPEWLYDSKPELFFKLADGSTPPLEIGVSCPAGGFNAGLCLDNPQSRQYGGEFLRQLAQRYRDHPALLGYDIWNETNFRGDVCYCEHTLKLFREWLKKKYGSLQELGKSWCRYSYSDWAQVRPPVTPDFYMESLDWQLFRKENVYAQMRWRIEQIRSVDPKGLIAAHGTAATFDQQTLRCYDDWEAAKNVELYGLTYIPSRHTGRSWKFWSSVDMTRNAARGKTFWHAEMQGGPLWLQPQVLGRPKDDARISVADDVRLYNLSSMACGTRGILYPRMRPLLNGPLFGAFGPYAMDGSRTQRSDMASSIAKWSNDPRQAKLLKAAPVVGQVGILITSHAQMGSYLLSRHGGQDAFAASVWGVYQGFFDNNIQTDYVYPEDIEGYRTLYVPYSVVMTDELADALKRWVARGNTLISEACPGYFNDRLTAGTVQPNLGLDELFGALEDEVEFTPDILSNLRLVINHMQVDGGVAIQTYRTTTGVPVGYLLDGRIAAVENTYGKGKTLLIGTHPSEAYFRTQSAENKAFFAQLLSFAGQEAIVKTNTQGVKARVQQSADGDTYLWVINATKERKEDMITISSAVRGRALGQVFWNHGTVEDLGNGLIHASIPPKDALIIELRPNL
jgi:beta-galactosidase